MKADGLEYDERMALLEEITWPQPLAELLERVYETYRQTAPVAAARTRWTRSRWCARCTSRGWAFTDFVGRYKLARSEGLVLRYLTDAYRTLRQTVPDVHRPPELEDLIEWLGETVRQTDSSLLDEWEALTDPDHVPRTVHRRAAAPAAPAVAAGAGVPGDDPQRACGAGWSWSRATTSTACRASSEPTPTASTRPARWW